MAKVALLIGVREYGSGLKPLPAAPKDVAAMQEVLQNPEMGGFDEVETLVNPNHSEMAEKIKIWFNARQSDDLVVLFFSGHGIKDESRELYFAASDTRKVGEMLIELTAVPASFVRGCLKRCKSKRQVVILDCCFSGAFGGLLAKDDGDVDLESLLGAEGGVVLTSSSSLEYSFEQEGSDLSIYTRYLVEGIRTGAADRDGDGAVSVDELHQFASKKVQVAAPAMTPKIIVFKELGYKIKLAKAPIGDPKLKYRKEVECRVYQGNFSIPARKLLKRRRDELGLSSEEADAIEAEVLQPYREHQHKLKEYEDTLTEALQEENPLSERTRNDLRDYQKHLGLTDKDVKEIEQRLQVCTNEIGTIKELRSRLEAIPHEQQSSVAAAQSQEGAVDVAASRPQTVVPEDPGEAVTPKAPFSDIGAGNEGNAHEFVILPMQLLSLDDAGGTDIGHQQEHNEDCFGIQTMVQKLENPMGRTVEAHGLYVLCDGMGGHPAGEAASAMAVETLKRYFQDHWRDDQLPTEATIREAIRQANQAIYEVNQKNARSGSGRMGTTLAMILIQNTDAAIAHVGDSRIYRLSLKHGLEQLTADHEVGQRQIQQGVDPEIAYSRPDARQLTQALGLGDEQFINPDLEFFELNEDTLFVLCSDGLSDNDLIETHWQTHVNPLLSSRANLDQGILQLIELANDHNGHDNITAIVIRFKVRPNLGVSSPRVIAI